MKLPNVNIESRGLFVPRSACYLEICRPWKVGEINQLDCGIPKGQDLRNKIIGTEESKDGIVKIHIFSEDVNLEEWMGKEAYIGHYAENIKDEHVVRLIETFTRSDGEYVFMILVSEPCVRILARSVGKGKWVLVRNASEEETTFNLQK